MTGRAPWFAPSGVVVRKSRDPELPYYLQRVTNELDRVPPYYGAHALIGEEFATREQAEARAAELHAHRGEAHP